MKCTVGFRTLLTDRNKLVMTVGGVTALAAGVYTTRYICLLLLLLSSEVWFNGLNNLKISSLLFPPNFDVVLPAYPVSPYLQMEMPVFFVANFAQKALFKCLRY